MTDGRPSSIATEIHQTKPFRSRSQEAVLALWRTAERIREQFGHIIKPAGITFQQYNVLRILRGAGDTGLPTLAIAERMIERAPGITRLIDRLVRRGLVSRKRSDDDRRLVVCRITPAGLALLGPLDAAMDETDDRAFACLTHNELGAMIHLLDRIRGNLR